MSPLWHPSPNFGPRRDGHVPGLVVLHYTAMQNAAAALERLCDPTAEVSAHYLIGLDGTVWQMVGEEARAWHAGAGSWGGQGDVNSRSIGIELDNRGDHPFPEPQMAALEELLSGILTRWDIAPSGVIGHSDMAPDRKQDPGRRFDWARLAHRGLAVWPGRAAAPGTLRHNARRFGYPDCTDRALLEAIRQRFRPQQVGPADERDLGMLQDLADRFGVDRAGPNA